MEKKRGRIVKLFVVSFIMLFIANITSNVVQIVFLVLGFVFLGLSIRQLFFTWRCPKCDAFLGEMFFSLPKQCKKCGKKF